MTHEKRKETRNADENTEVKETFIHCGWESKLVQYLCKSVSMFFKKLKIKLLYDTAIPLLNIYPKEC
jgi:hypothetical protein